MNSYDLYIILRGIGELMAPFIPVVVAVAIGICALLGLRLWLRLRIRSAAGTDLAQRLQDAEQRIAALEQQQKGTRIRADNGT